MAWTTPSTATAGSVLTAAFWNTQVRDNLTEAAPFFAAWTTFTPQLWSGGSQATTSTAVGKYLRVGKMIMLHVKLVASGSGGAGTLEIRNLPSATYAKTNGGANNAQFVEVGHAILIDAGTATYFEPCYIHADGYIRMLNIPSGAVDRTITIASGDSFNGFITYEAA